MMQRTHAGIGFVKLSDSDFVLKNPEQDVRGKDVHNRDGERIGSVDDLLYIDTWGRKARFLEVGTGGFLGAGERHLLVPVEAVAEVGEDRVVVEPEREGRAVSPPFDHVGTPRRRPPERYPRHVPVRPPVVLAGRL